MIILDNYYDTSDAHVSMKNIYFKNIICDSEGQIMKIQFQIASPITIFNWT